MIGYVTMGTNDLARGAKFYDELLNVMGAKRTMDMGTFIAWGNDPTNPMFSLTEPFDKNPATVGNGVMVAFMASDTEQVKTIYNKALELGATDEGAPGPRGEGFYAGYFRDLDGNKLNAFCVVASE